VLERFKPDLIHITGPSEVGMLGAGGAPSGLPLAASWHTNVHEYAARRSIGFCVCFRSAIQAATGQTIEDLAMATAANSIPLHRCCSRPIPISASGLNR